MLLQYPLLSPLVACLPKGTVWSLLFATPNDFSTRNPLPSPKAPANSRPSSSCRISPFLSEPRLQDVKGQVHFMKQARQI